MALIHTFIQKYVQKNLLSPLLPITFNLTSNAINFLGIYPEPFFMWANDTGVLATDFATFGSTLLIG